MNKKLFFQKLRFFFSKNNIYYLILRGFNFLNDEETYGEIDILLKKNDFSKFKKNIRKEFIFHKFKYNIDLNHRFLIRFHGENFNVDLDFQINGIGYRGIPMLKESILLENTKKEKDFRVLNDNGKFLMFIFHSFIFKTKFEYFNKYEDELIFLYKIINKKYVFHILGNIFNKKISKKILMFCREKNFRKLFKYKFFLILNYLLKNPFDFFKMSISSLMVLRNYYKLNIFSNFINIFYFAPLITFIGPDGCGKSTFSKKSEKFFKNYGIDTKLIKSDVFISMPFKINKKKTTNNREYNKKINRNEFFLKSVIRIILQLYKQLKILYYRKIGKIVICDRYIYDIFFLYNENSFIKFILKHFFQKPTICFFLEVSSKFLKKRNNELSIKSINKINSLCMRNKKDFDLVCLKNKNFSKSNKKLKSYLSKLV